VLATLEVDVASVCASTPVFWPVLRDHVLTIFVTREVKITRSGPDIDDAFEMRRTTSNTSSLQGSQVGLHGKDIEKANGNTNPFNEVYSYCQGVSTKTYVEANVSQKKNP
jgi:hypothetical protein